MRMRRPSGTICAFSRSLPEPARQPGATAARPFGCARRLPGRRRPTMFHYRNAPELSSIEGRLRAIEGDLARYGRKAGRRASSGISAAGEQIGESLSPILSEIADRLRDGGRYAGDEAARFGNEAVKIGARV